MSLHSIRVMAPSTDRSGGYVQWFRRHKILTHRSIQPTSTSAQNLFQFNSAHSVQPNQSLPSQVCVCVCVCVYVCVRCTLRPRGPSGSSRSQQHHHTNTKRHESATHLTDTKRHESATHLTDIMTYNKTSNNKNPNQPHPYPSNPAQGRAQNQSQHTNQTQLLFYNFIYFCHYCLGWDPDLELKVGGECRNPFPIGMIHSAYMYCPDSFIMRLLVFMLCADVGIVKTPATERSRQFAMRQVCDPRYTHAYHQTPGMHDLHAVPYRVAIRLRCGSRFSLQIFCRHTSQGEGDETP